MKTQSDRNRAQEQKGHPDLTQPATERRSSSTLWTPEDVAAHLLATPLVSSRSKVEWKRSMVERRNPVPQELIAPPVTHHCLGLPLGAPYYYWRKNGREIAEGLVTPGCATIFPAGRPSHTRWKQCDDVLSLYLAPQLLEHLAEPFMAHPESIELLPLFSVPDPQIEHIGRALHAELEQGSPSGRLFSESLTTALAVRLLRHYVAFPATIPDITHKLTRTEMSLALDYIHDNLSQDLSLQQIAQVSGVSANYLTTLFKRTTGYSLHQYVIRQRVEKAKSLLLRSELSIGEIAQQVGFYDSAHLTRHFKRLTGVTSRAMRQRS